MKQQRLLSLQTLRQPPEWLAWVMLGVFTVAATVLVWANPGTLFLTNVSGDGPVAAWYYDWYAYTLRTDGSLHFLNGLDFPAPHSRLHEFPESLEALLLAPLAWVLGWPAQWAAMVCLNVALQGLACAALARGLGCRGWGITASGALGVLSLYVWRDVAQGRTNSAWLGLAIGALAVLLNLLAPDPVTRKNKAAPLLLWLKRSPLVIASVALLIGSAAIYPPHLALALAAGAPLVLLALWRAPTGAFTMLAAVEGLAWLLVGSELQEMSTSGMVTSRVNDMSTWTTTCSHFDVPQFWHLFLIDLDWVHTKADMATTGLAAGVWVLAVLALARKGSRLSVGLSIGAAMALCLVAMGSCEALYPRGLAPLLRSGLVQRVLEQIAFVHDYNRLTGVAASLLIGVGGLGVEWLLRRPGARGLILGWVVTLGVILNASSVLLQKIYTESAWREWSPPAVSEVLDELEPGPLAEIPYDVQAQFFSAMVHPEFVRTNPLRPWYPQPNNDPLIRWLNTVATPEAKMTKPPRSIEGTRLRWIYYERARCPMNNPACRNTLPKMLAELLGPPTEAGIGLLWEIPEGTRR